MYNEILFNFKRKGILMSVRTCINLEEMISEIGQTQEDNYA